MESAYQKMLSGQAYNAYAPELVALRLAARQLLRAYNQSEPQFPEARDVLLTRLLGSRGERVEIEPPFYCDYGRHIHVGENFYANFNCTILDPGEVRIGDNVFFGPNVQLYTASHPLDAGARNAGDEFAAPITIGHSVWVGGGAIINPGVTIGDETVIGSGSVVTRSVPPGVVAAGVPCQVIRRLKKE